MHAVVSAALGLAPPAIKNLTAVIWMSWLLTVKLLAYEAGIPGLCAFGSPPGDV